MSFGRSIERGARARAVADAPVQALLERADELSRRWAAALVLARPLDAIAEIPLEGLARAAPALCRTLASALASDEQLERLARGDGERAELAPPLVLAREPSAIVADVDALRSIFWEATLDGLHDPPARLLADLADRLSYVCAIALAAMLDERGVAASASAAPRVTAPTAGRGHVLYSTQRDASHRAGAVLVDELGEDPRPLAAAENAAEEPPRAGVPGVGGAVADRVVPPSAPSESVSPSPEPDPSRAMPRGRPWDTPLSDEPTMRVRRGPGVRVDERD
jgi:hypothetical protein